MLHLPLNIDDMVILYISAIDDSSSSDETKPLQNKHFSMQLMAVSLGYVLYADHKPNIRPLFKDKMGPVTDNGTGCRHFGQRLGRHLVKSSYFW